MLAGPTASGKSDVAQAIAEREGFGILSADSMAVYRGLDIGTAKPSLAARSRVPYYGLDLADPSDRFSVWDYRQAALAALDAADRPLIVAGGTGLYIKSLTHGLDAGAGADAGLRQTWEARVAESGLEPLRAAATAAAPAAVAALDGEFTFRRLIRILERSRAGDPDRAPQAWQAAPAPALTGLRLDRDTQNLRIAQRVRWMYSHGLVEEVAGLLASGIELSPTARQAIGYAETIDCLAGHCTQAEAEARTLVRTRRLAKRQRTWFRTQAEVVWFDWQPGITAAAMAARIGGYWHERGPATLAG